LDRNFPLEALELEIGATWHWQIDGKALELSGSGGRDGIAGTKVMLLPGCIYPGTQDWKAPSAITFALTGAGFAGVRVECFVSGLRLANANTLVGANDSQPQK